MGWLYCAATRAELIEALIKPHDGKRYHTEVIAHAVRGNVLWTVVNITAKEPNEFSDMKPGERKNVIGCDLLAKYKGQWGYKNMSELMHPVYYTCPLRYLDMAPVQSEAWREGVRAYHAQRRRVA